MNFAYYKTVVLKPRLVLKICHYQFTTWYLVLMVLHIYGLCSIEDREKAVLHFELIKMESA